MLFKSPKVDFLHTKMFSRSRFFFFASEERPSRRVRTSSHRHFDRRAKALWGDDVRWLLDSHALGKFAAKCRTALLLSVVFKLKTGKSIPKFAFTSFRMMWQYDERGFMLLEGRPCPKIHVCVRSTSKSIALKSLKGCLLSTLGFRKVIISVFFCFHVFLWES